MFKSMHRFFQGRVARFYSKSHWHLVLDLSLVIIMICLIIASIVLFLYRPGFIFNLSSFGSYAQPAVDINNPPLSTEMVPAGDTIAMDEGIALNIKLKNNGAAPISGLKIILETTDADFSVKKIEQTNDQSGLSLNDKTIVLTKLAAGMEKEIGAKVHFNRKNENRVINWQARIEYIFGGQVLHNTISLPSLRASAEIKLSDAAYYTSPQGDQLGIGPLPPLVGIPTNYWIFFEAKSDADWRDLVVGARLPRGVELTDSRSLLAGDFNYNPETRQLIWRIPAFIGRSESYRLGFEVQLLPTADQVGKVMTLLDSPQYYATDVLTEQEKSGSLDKLTTDLDKDRFNSGQGKVVSE